ncbi:peptide deformylase [Porphyromonadaceae bacterium W3.11]|nr:peptide deformylase [Porphyromonadaceae bacterium W3.11]
MTLPIYIYGTDVLREETKEIEADYPGLEKLIANMFETMYQSDGVGLAAPQVGKSIRLFVIDASPVAEDFEDSKDFKRVVINPEIISSSEEVVSMWEGCLSLPGLSEKVERPASVTVKYLNERFELVEETLHNFNARVFQHEYDHLEETLFTDKISPMRKQMVKKKLQKMSRGNVSASYKMVTK